jgi:hypothetical protein
MKFVYATNESHPNELKITDSTKFGSVVLNQTFFPEIVDGFLGPQEHVFMHYREISKYLNKFIPEEKHSWDYHYSTDISGLIIPIQHGDMNEILNMRGLLKDSYKKREPSPVSEAWEEVRMYQRRSDDYWSNPRYKQFVEEAVKGSEKMFFESFGFPIFEAHKFFPGHREVPIPIGLESPYLADEKIINKNLEYVKNAFKFWLENNFTKKG